MADAEAQSLSKEELAAKREADKKRKAALVRVADEDVYLLPGCMHPFKQVKGMKTGGTLKLLMREGPHGAIAEEVADVIENIPPRKVNPYIAWIAPTVAEPPSVRLTLQWSVEQCVLNKDVEFHPVECKTMSRASPPRRSPRIQLPPRRDASCGSNGYTNSSPRS